MENTRMLQVTKKKKKKKTRVAEKADFSQFFVVLNFPFVFQYTHMTAFFFTRMRQKLTGKAFLEMGSRRVF